jgi:hypothetical protein
MYSCDKAQLWKPKDKDNVFLYKPTVLDIDSKDKYEIHEYVQKVVSPSYHYFLLEKEIKVRQDQDELLPCLVIQAFSLFFVIQNTRRLFPFANDLIIILSTLAICCLGCFIIYKLYERFFAIEDFEYSIDDLKNMFKYQKNEFKLDEEKAFNNYVISEHYRYLSCISDSVIIRKSILRIVMGAAAIIYFLFFMVPD